MDIDAEEEDVKTLAADGAALSPVVAKADPDLSGYLPAHLRLSLQLTLSMLSRALSRPTRKIGLGRAKVRAPFRRVGGATCSHRING
jgi:hypothetical protein